MEDLFNSYMQGSQNLNTFLIRHLAGQEYVFSENQDVYEFLTALSVKCNNYTSDIEHELTIQFVCHQFAYRVFIKVRRLSEIAYNQWTCQNCRKTENPIR